MGGFSGLYPILKAMEEAGRIRRGYFVAGLGAAQFAASGAEDRLRDLDRPAEQDADDADSRFLMLSATDPANPYGAALRWPDHPGGGKPQRVAGARVLLFQGELLGHLGRTGQHLLTFLTAEQPERAQRTTALQQMLVAFSQRGGTPSTLVR